MLGEETLAAGVYSDIASGHNTQQSVLHTINIHTHPTLPATSLPRFMKWCVPPFFFLWENFTRKKVLISGDRRSIGSRPLLDWQETHLRLLGSKEQYCKHLQTDITGAHRSTLYLEDMEVAFSHGHRLLTVT